MARQPATTTGRASVEAIEKRRVARELNALLSDAAPNPNDGRTLRRRVRLLKEIKEGRGGKPLKAIELLTRVDALLKLGETLSSIRKNGVLLPTVPLPADAQSVVARTQAAYAFDPKVWKILGADVQPSRVRARPRPRSTRAPRRT